MDSVIMDFVFAMMAMVKKIVLWKLVWIIVLEKDFVIMVLVFAVLDLLEMIVQK
jgi:hypothetical protein